MQDKPGSSGGGRPPSGARAVPGGAAEAKAVTAALVEAIRHPVLLLTADFNVAMANLAFHEMFAPEAGTVEGEPLWSIADSRLNLPELRAMAKGEAESVRELSLDTRLPNAGLRSLTVDATRLAESGFVLLTIEDVTDRQPEEAYHSLMLMELQHRVRNNMASVRAIAQSTYNSSRTLQEFFEVFDGRLRALGLSQRSAAQSGQAGVDLTELVSEQLESLGGRLLERVSLDGWDIQVDERAAEMLSLAVHELAVNAIRYGAFADDEGTVTTSWKVQDGELIFQWHEDATDSGGPPERRGFGRDLLENGISYSLGGSSRLDFNGQGLDFSCRLPADEYVKSYRAGGTLKVDLSGMRVLIVEDNFFIANAIARALGEAGAEPVGPAPNLKAARELAKGRIDMAVLDIDLGRTAVYPLARELAARGVLFLFVTGYEFARVERDFQDRPMLRKPFDDASLLRAVDAMVARAGRLT